MLRKFFSALFLLTSIVIVLGSLGHASQWTKHVHDALTGVAPQAVELLEYIWYWVSGAMCALGLLLIWTWWRIRRGDRGLFFIPWIVGLFYLAEGICGMIYVAPFFSVFVILALLLFVSTWALQHS